MRLNIKSDDFQHGMHARDVIVPDKLKERHKTGIDFVNTLYGGQGMTPSTVTLLTGTPGAGKTTLGLELADALTNEGHVCLYNSCEESVYQVKATCDRLGLKGDFYIGQDSLIDSTWSIVAKNRRDEPSVLEHARMIMRKHPGQQFFLISDSLQAHDDGKYHDFAINQKTAVRVLQRSTEFAKAEYAIIIFIGQVGKDGKFSGENKLKHMVDCHAHLTYEEDPEEDDYEVRYLVMEKNRFGSAGKVIALTMSKHGIYPKGSRPVSREGL